MARTAALRNARSSDARPTHKTALMQQSLAHRLRRGAHEFRQAEEVPTRSRGSPDAEPVMHSQRLTPQPVSPSWGPSYSPPSKSRMGQERSV